MLRLNVCCLRRTGVFWNILVVFTYEEGSLAEWFMALWSNVTHPKKNPRTSSVSAWNVKTNKFAGRQHMMRFSWISYWCTFWVDFHGEKTFKRTVLIPNLAQDSHISPTPKLKRKHKQRLVGGSPTNHHLFRITREMCVFSPNHRETPRNHGWFFHLSGARVP